MSAVPGLHSLGEQLYTGPRSIPLDRPLTDEEISQLKEARQIADNAMSAVAHGIAGIGHILGGIGDHRRDEIDQDILDGTALSDIGWFLEGLGMLVVTLDNTQANIEFTRAHHAAFTGKVPEF